MGRRCGRRVRRRSGRRLDGRRMRPCRGSRPVRLAVRQLFGGSRRPPGSGSRFWHETIQPVLDGERRPAILQCVVGMVGVSAFRGCVPQPPVFRPMVPPAVFGHGVCDFPGVDEQSELPEEGYVEVGVVYADFIGPVEDGLDFFQVHADVRPVCDIAWRDVVDLFGFPPCGVALGLVLAVEYGAPVAIDDG